MATIEKIIVNGEVRQGKRVPVSINISGNRTDKGELTIKTIDMLRVLNKDGTEPSEDTHINNYQVPVRKETVIGGLEAIPEKKRQDFMDTIGQMIDTAYQKAASQ